ncbi:hypothetical protein L3Q72_18095 [Vibrio sp. JC009]|uniref:hypothetical protein n=1 Tax=Vibrio sp. JC009 TaxID=2912314 RepID=UPI0023B082C2|nr:hypothetical protein [Vibrio sp. JC009]WED24788.1 hypothetical protein L3Q72_18095 [Vibrio sp. JC009]
MLNANCSHRDYYRKEVGVRPIILSLLLIKFEWVTGYRLQVTGYRLQVWGEWVFNLGEGDYDGLWGYGVMGLWGYGVMVAVVGGVVEDGYGFRSL